MDKPITVVVNTRNEGKNIAGCLSSIRNLTDKIIVVDMESTDETVETAKKFGALVFNFPQKNYVEPARQFAILKSKTDWVMVIDADEEITPELAVEIKSLEDSCTHYKIPRKNVFGRTKWLRHGGWWPDYQTRLINKSCLKAWPKRIHSTPIITGKAGHLNNPILHYFHGDLESMVKKTLVFEDIESGLLHKAKKTATTATFFRKYFAELYRRLLKNLGFLDGTPGVMESIYQAFSKTITYLFVYEKSRNL